MKRLSMISMTALLFHSAFAAPAESTLAKSLREMEHVANSLHMDKPAQARVFAFDGTEYTSAEALWIKAHVRAARRALAGNDMKDAIHELDLVTATLRSHGSSVAA